MLVWIDLRDIFLSSAHESLVGRVQYNVKARERERVCDRYDRYGCQEVRRPRPRDRDESEAKLMGCQGKKAGEPGGKEAGGRSELRLSPLIFCSRPRVCRLPVWHMLSHGPIGARMLTYIDNSKGMQGMEQRVTWYTQKGREWNLGTWGTWGT